MDDIYAPPPWEESPQPEHPVIDPKKLQGLWIPAKYLYENDLTQKEILLVSFIHMMDQDNHCYASNRYLGELMGCNEKTVRNMLVELKKKGYIEQVSWNGKIRKLKCL